MKCLDQIWHSFKIIHLILILFTHIYICMQCNATHSQNESYKQTLIYFFYIQFLLCRKSLFARVNSKKRKWRKNKCIVNEQCKHHPSLTSVYFFHWTFFCGLCPIISKTKCRGYGRAVDARLWGLVQSLLAYSASCQQYSVSS